MLENKLKHLEFIQNAIIRMNSNSFLLKGWSLTLISALFALAAKDSNTNYILITYAIIPIFWILDGFFLSAERQYRDHYNHVRQLENSKIDFDMNIVTYKKGNRTWASSIISITLLLFHGSLVVTALIVMFFIEN